MIKNKKAGFEYELIEKFNAGMVLVGTEIKSIREGNVGFVDSFCSFQNGELWCIGLHISEYKHGTYLNHEPRRSRKLLLSKRELKKIQGKMKESGLTVVPVNVYINDNGYAKMTISLARGKKLYDKRETIKDRDVKRDMERQN